jgi:hypothetical protein
MEKFIGFKKIVFFSCFFFLLNIGSYGQKTLPVYDGINYTVGTLAYDNANWWCLTPPTPTNDITVASGSLSYSGLLESTANNIKVGGAGDDIVIWFGDRAADTKIYYSFIFQVTDMAGIGAGTPAHFAGFSNSYTTTGSLGCSIFFQKDVTDQTKFNIGHSTRSSVVPVWNSVASIPVQYSVNTPIFIVGCYEIIGTFLDGTPNDKSSMWINPSSATFENALPPTASLTSVLIVGGPNDINPVRSFYIRQDAVSNTPLIDIDEIRIGSLWAEVTPKSIATSANDFVINETGIKIFPNPVKDILKVDIKNSDIRLIEIYNITGTRLLTKKAETGTNNIDVSSLPQGIYSVSFKGTGAPRTGKFIKK